MQVKGVGAARFSLQGFEQAYLDAKNTCQQYATEQQPLSGSLPLSTDELSCRILGVFVQEYATKRDQGVALTDALMQLREWVATAGHPPAIQSLHEQLLLSAYRDTWLTPGRARQQFETTCVLQMHK